MNTQNENCRNHPDRRAVGVCRACGKPICRQCVGEQRDDMLLCFDCALESSLDDFSEWDTKQVQRGKERRSEVDLHRKRREKKTEQKAFRIFLVVCFVIFAIEGTILLTDYLLQRKEEISFISSHEIERRYNRDVSVNDLHMIGNAIESYTSQNTGALPEDLDALITEYMVTLPTDPMTGRDYTYGVVNGEYIVASPNPELYGLRFLANRNGRVYHEEIR
jgi:hypothetical protein